MVGWHYRHNGHEFEQSPEIVMYYSDSLLKLSPCCLLLGTADCSYPWDGGPGRNRS